MLDVTSKARGFLHYVTVHPSLPPHVEQTVAALAKQTGASLVVVSRVLCTVSRVTSWLFTSPLSFSYASLPGLDKDVGSGQVCVCVCVCV